MGRRSPGSLRSLRERNRLQVLEVVRGSGSVSRADIARRTGLADPPSRRSSTSCSAPALLVERGAPEDGNTTQGRPPALLSFDPGAGAVIGMHFDHPGAAGRVADLGHTSSPRRPCRSTSTTTPRIARCRGRARSTRSSRPPAWSASGCSAPVPRSPGCIDSAHRARLDARPSCPAGSACRSAQELEARLGLPVHVDNDANVGALGGAASAPAAAPRTWRTSCSARASAPG